MCMPKYAVNDAPKVCALGAGNAEENGGRRGMQRELGIPAAGRWRSPTRFVGLVVGCHGARRCRVTADGGFGGQTHIAFMRAREYKTGAWLTVKPEDGPYSARPLAFSQHV